MEHPVAVATDIAPNAVDPAKESPSLSSTTVQRCTDDCKRCVVRVIAERMAEKERLRHAEASELQDRFDRQAFGFLRPGDEHVRTLPQMEASLHEIATNIAGCDKATGGARLMTVSMLGDARAHMNELVKAARALYISDAGEGAHRAAPKEEPPFVPPVPWTFMQRLLRSWGIKI